MQSSPDQKKKQNRKSAITDFFAYARVYIDVDVPIGPTDTGRVIHVNVVVLSRTNRFAGRSCTRLIERVFTNVHHATCRPVSLTFLLAGRLRNSSLSVSRCSPSLLYITGPGDAARAYRHRYNRYTPWLLLRRRMSAPCDGNVISIRVLRKVRRPRTIYYHYRGEARENTTSSITRP